MASTIKVDNIQNQSGETFNTVSWDTTAKTADFTAVSGRGYFVNTTSTAVTATLPASPLAGDTITFSDYTGTFQINNLTIDRNGSNIRGSASNFILNKENQTITLVYVDATEGWNITQESNNTTNFLEATGGTETTCGDYKIHTFTGPGTFTVSCAGNPVGSNAVDYLVVAGGGAGGISTGAGGGGAGGYRTSFPSPAGVIPVSATGYPITVGSGGAGGSPSVASTSGNPSIFSTITSTGGGYGGWQNCTPEKNGAPGGSGGGSRYNAGASGGSGNTPPVSPPQGNNGGAGSGVNYTGSGGGGAGAVGSVGSPTSGGNGGVGLANTISGSPVFSAGGGGGATCAPGPASSGGNGGGGNGGKGPGAGTQATAGTANTGGGGGGGDFNGTAANSNGGSGIVIIRYKFQ